jgi:hypothetical protein
MVGKTIVNQGRVVRPSQLIRGVGPTRRGRGRAMGCQDRSDGHNK